MEKRVILTFDDSVKNHAERVAPFLVTRGFNATFFITEWNREWNNLHGSMRLSHKDMQQIASMGFELGNHTHTHGGSQSLTHEGIEREIVYIEVLFQALGLPKPRTFAYPGGPYSEEAAKILKERNYLAARCVEERSFDPATEDPFRLPAYAVTEKNGGFTRAMEEFDRMEDSRCLILVYHGIPDQVHPWVNTEVETFESQMDELATRGAQVLSLAQLYES
ncbi:MAG: polysaccharide deacetylase family protein [Victivallaceae bacterium]|nr:polysaccharide deacetylase family protein [Victivallaceae bacterium]